MLTEIHDMQNILQMAGLGWDASAAKLGALPLFMQNEWDNIVEEAKIKAAIFCDQVWISRKQWMRKKKMAEECTVDTGLSLHDEIKWE